MYVAGERKQLGKGKKVFMILCHKEKSCHRSEVFAQVVIIKLPHGINHNRLRQTIPYMGLLLCLHEK